MGTIEEKYVYMIACHFTTNNLQLKFHCDLPYQFAHANGDISTQYRFFVLVDPYQMNLKSDNMKDGLSGLHSVD